jgi:glc operon protein GlcG
MQQRIPYGVPIGLARAMDVAAAARAEAELRGWQLSIAITDPSGDLVYLERMDDAHLASWSIALEKARTAARFRRPTKAFFDAIDAGRSYIMTLSPGLVAVPGGLPIILGGRIIGAIGVSGGTGEQDELIASSGVGTIT